MIFITNKLFRLFSSRQRGTPRLSDVLSEQVGRFDPIRQPAEHRTPCQNDLRNRSKAIRDTKYNIKFY
ncbi:MAG: hypothetical protein A3A97_01270 [Candidatus Terrybacteria bacterium RIFCSPLOWO2_01_FULL_40_23]|uniref:Uncharacterized protein n=1 Tax=Candidatus Terrybacteria bacterium RIFCSPLOWO2_01_FULL_40_23 TaxID=1802366 RepID=A0A1G2PRX7_9BACT|nr:MAG: hypothetical protein A3A97_01270 [Candidatus Terrybacteria bacterium RIFCSPLOWO2_01_FULL_40_23]